MTRVIASSVCFTFLCVASYFAQTANVGKGQGSPATAGTSTRRTVIPAKAQEAFAAGHLFYISSAERKPVTVDVFFQGRSSFGSISIDFVVNPTHKPDPAAFAYVVRMPILLAGEPSQMGGTMESETAAAVVSKSRTGRLELPFTLTGLFEGDSRNRGKLSVTVVDKEDKRISNTIEVEAVRK